MAITRPAEVEREMADETMPISAEKAEPSAEDSCRNMVSEP